MELLFNMKELYDISIRCISPMEIDGYTYATDEAILHFDKVLVSQLDPQEVTKYAAGGVDNEELLYWTKTRGVTFSFTQGVISKKGLAALSNNKMKKISTTDIWCLETLIPDLDDKITLKHTPLAAPIFINHSSTNEKITDYTVAGKEITFAASHASVTVNYKWTLASNSSILQIGKKLQNGYFSIDAKMRTKDDDEGKTRTTIITMEKVRLIAGLSIRLGSASDFSTYDFVAAALPVGMKGDKSATSIVFLEEDIDEAF